MNFLSISSTNLSIIINSSILFLIVILSSIVLWKIKLIGKGYKLLFIVYTIFWIPLMLLRENTGNLGKALEESSTLWLPLAAYGFIGIFARPIADLLAYKTWSRRSFIYMALFIQIVTYIPVIAIPCLATNIIQSLGVGLGASCIGSYQLLFNEQYGKSKQFLTISVLSIPPLLADFIASPITSIFRSSNNFNVETLKYLWLIGLVFIIFACFLAFFIHEDKNLLFKDNKSKVKVYEKNGYIYFALLLTLGFLIGFIKFSNSGANAVLHIQKLSNSTSGSYEGYLSVLYSIGQLIGGLLVGLVLIRVCPKWSIYLIGSIIWIVYEILSIFIFNPYAYLGVHILNGLSYGILYNLILGFILQLYFNTKRITPMGIYQAVLSIGITLSNFYVNYLKSILSPEGSTFDQYRHVMIIINAVVIAAIAISAIIYLITYQFDKKISSKIDENKLVR